MTEEETEELTFFILIVQINTPTAFNSRFNHCDMHNKYLSIEIIVFNICIKQLNHPLNN